MSRQVFVIVGASLAGLRAAESLRSRGFDGRLVLIGEERHAPYERPPLSKAVLLGRTGLDALTLRHDWEEIGVEFVAGDRVVEIVADSREVVLASGARIRADKVLLATGGRPVDLALPGADLDGIFTLRDIDEAVELAPLLAEGRRVVVVGGGFIGLEVAASARMLGCDVTVVEAATVPLARGLGPVWGGFIAEHHLTQGVRIGTGVGVASFGGLTSVQYVELDDGTVLEADLAVVGVGMRPRTALAAGLGVKVDGGIVVDAGARTTNRHVFAAGDVTVQPSWSGDRLVRYESYQNAQDQAAIAAAAMLDQEPPRREPPWFWSDQFDLNIQTAGELGGADEVIVRGDRDSASFAAFHLHGDRVAGVFAVNRGRDVRAGMKLMEADVPVSADELMDESVDLRRLAKRVVAHRRS
ncbi:FAD-dependent oxidoreductase [Nocardioides sp. BP30]|uniref:NAD(P)/FAD-dependent oxidoreductase n=1 Tax=Nocardioides sp. BP30 TaxID=3036374 RepID=UPI002468B9AA|nr:FAD-dependent oxidoreductase [Nocardioides sp. BP30]WGL50789.1 FAD-dependent oxidoreductase [Nocardioides sp. BP30]